MRIATNFSAGPAALPHSVVERFVAEFDDYQGSGYSIAECSHRSSLYTQLHHETIKKIRRALAISAEYEVLLLAGGATLQFALLPYNFSHENSGSYCVTGAWGEKAYQSAAANILSARTPHIAYNGAPHSYRHLPSWDDLTIAPESAYLHITSNETINGIQFKRWPSNTLRLPLVADMSSDLMTKPLPVSRFAMIYASAQKNLGIAGVTVVVIRKEFLSTACEELPPYCSYKIHASKHSLYNTPPTVSIFSLDLMMDWIMEQGGLISVNARNLQKAHLLYSYLDDHADFYRNDIPASDRSIINVIFTLPNDLLTKRFLAAAENRAENRIVGIGGHRSVGGCRVSLYNAVELKAVEQLIDFMDSFLQKVRKNG